MAERNLESNIVLQTVLPQPKGSGFESLHRQLSKIERKLEGLTNRDWRIKVTLDDSGLSASNVKITSTLKKTADQAKKQVKEVSDAVYQMGDKMQSSTDGMLTNIRTAITATEKGIKRVITETREDVRNRLQSKVQFTETPGGFKQTESVTDLAAKERLKQQKSNDPAVIAARNQAIINKATLEDYRQTGRLLLQEEKRAGKSIEQQKKQDQKQQEEIDRTSKIVALATLQEERKQKEEINKVSSKVAIETRKQDQKRQEEIDRTSKIIALATSKEEAKQKEELNKITNRAILQDHKHTGKVLQQEAAKQAKDSLLARNQFFASQVIGQAGKEGFVRQKPTSERFNPRTGELETIQEFKRISGNALRGYTVEVIRANAATGEFNKTVLRGAAASRAMGDSLGHSIQKVALWSAATGSVFLAVRGFYEVSQAVMDLEQSTTLLARVGRGLGDGFKERQTEARGVTSDILKMTAAIGGNSEEALRSAAIFAREGKDRKGIVDGVRASLLAARIAELDVAEATNLVSSAMSQFKIPAGDAVLTLDKLNTLSNNYRVTTGDLLQSISRSGSIIAQQNGRLSELAAVTAVTAQNTSRTGAEIGNAIKTIASQIDRVETKKYIFENLGIAVHDVGGESKSYTRFLLEMSLALDQATDAERNLATTQVAGVRQRNILLTQLRDIAEIIKAENVTVLGRPGKKADKDDQEFGSSVAELLQTSNTLDSSLSRLRAQIIESAQSLGGGFIDLAKNLANILTMISRWTAAGNELTNSMTGQVIVIASIAAALRLLSGAYNVNIRTITVYMRYLSMQIHLQGGASAAAYKLGAAMAASAASAAASIAVFASIAFVVNAVIDTMGQYARQQQLLSEIENSRSSLLDRLIDREKNAAQRYRVSAEAIISYTESIRKLKEEQARTGKDNSAAISKLESGAKLIADSAGFTVGPGTTIGNIQNQSIAKEKEANARQARNIEEKAKLLKESKRIKDEELKKEEAILSQGQGLQDYLNSQRSPTKSSRRGYIGNQTELSEFALRARRRTTTTYVLGISKEDVKETILSTESAIAKLRNESDEAGASIRDLDSALGELKQFKAFQDSGGYDKAVKVLSQFARLNEGNAEKRENRFSTLSTGNTLRETVARYNEVRDATREAEDALNKMRAGGTIAAGQAEDAERQVIKNLEEEKKLYVEIQQIRLKAIADETQRITNDESAFRQSSRSIQSKLERGLSNSSSHFGDRIADIDARRSSLQLDNVALGQEFKQLNGMRPMDPAAAEQQALAIQSKQLAIAKNLNDMRGLEYDRVLAIKEAEADIAIERKKSADEAARALGVLSKEDKIRVLAQAQWFARNPNAKVSLEQQFLGSSEGNAIGQKFFGSRYEGMGNGSLSKLLGLAGLGGSQELEKGAAEVAAARGGLTDAQLAEQARRKNLQLGQRGAAVEGNDVKNDVIQFRKDGGAALAQGPNALLDLVVRHDLDLGPLTKQIDRSLEVKMQDMIVVISKEFEAIVDRKVRIAQKVPRVAP